MRAAVWCVDCKHWDTSGNTSVASLPPGYGQCALISDDDRERPTLAKTAFGYDLFTKPTFGCVLGEKK